MYSSFKMVLIFVKPAGVIHESLECCGFSAAGDPEITIYTNALVYYDGTIVWKPPAIYKSFCPVS